jgi:hypothetical protein
MELGYMDSWYPAHALKGAHGWGTQLFRLVE